MGNGLRLLALFACIALLGAAVPWLTRGYERDAAAERARAHPQFREIAWSELVPAGWDPLAGNTQASLARIDDGSAQARALAERMRTHWDNAPTRSALDGAMVRLSGYLVPLESDQGRLHEFLLVPFFGACIHSPPPAANQMVHVRLETPQADLHTMDVVWVSGRLESGRTDSQMGTAGYRMQAMQLERRKLVVH